MINSDGDDQQSYAESQWQDRSDYDQNYLEMHPLSNIISTVTTSKAAETHKNLNYAKIANPRKQITETDLERNLDSKLLPQKRLFSFFYNKYKIPDLPEDDERQYIPFKDWNPFNRCLYLWCFRILYVGYRRTIQPQDCYKLPDDHKVEYMYKKFLVHWEKSLERKKQRKLLGKKEPKFAHISLIWTLFWTFKWTYSYAILCFIISNVASAFNPLIIKSLVNFVEERNANSFIKIDKGVGYTAGTVILMFLGSISFAQGYSHAYFVGVYSRSILTKALLAKSLKLSAKGKHEFSMSKITTIATADLSRVEIAASNHPYIWAFPFSLVIALALLVSNIGSISLVGVGYFALSLFVSSFGFKNILKYRVKANVYTDERVSLISEILNYLKIIKYYAWENAYERLVTEKRKKEIGQVKKMQYIQSTVVAHGLLIPTLASLITFLLLFKISPYHSAASIFSSLSLFNILSSQMLFFPNSVGNTINAVIALERVQEVLLADEQDHLLKKTPCDNLQNALELKNCNFVWEKFEETTSEQYLQQINEDHERSREKDKELIKENVKVEVNEFEVESYETNNEKFKGLLDITLEFKKGEFVVVTGSIGTGKSSFLLALAHLMKKVSGHFKQNGELLLCGSPWVQNTTIRENIIFGKPFDEIRYRNTIEICSLTTDLKNLPAGEFTEIGERGITLSGGQKARINLARTVYREVDIYLFDDILSAVDAKVGKHIMEQCILGELSEKTRILATHQLNLIKDADKIVFLSSDGTYNVDTMDNLLKNSLEFYNLMSNAVDTTDSESEVKIIAKEENNTSEAIDDIECQPQKYTTSSQSILEEVEEVEEEKEEEEEVEEVEIQKRGKLTTEEEKAVNSVGTDIYSNFIKASVGKYWILAICVILLVCSITTFFSLFSSVWLSFWTENKYNRKREFYMAFYGLWNVLLFIFILLEIVSIGTTSIVAAQNLHISALHNILHAPMSYMDVTPLGRILNRFTKDIDILDNQLPFVLVLTFYIAADIVGVVIMCIIYMPWFAIAIPFIVLIYLLISNHYQSTGLELKRLESVQRSLVYNNFNEMLSGLETIKSYKVEEQFLKKLDKLTDTQNESGLLYLFLQRWSGVWMVNLVILFSIIITFLCISGKFGISASSVGLLLTYVLQLSLTVKELLFETTQTENYMNSVERVITYTTNLPQEKAYNIPEMKPEESWPQEANVTFENVSLSYRPGLPLVLKNIDLTIKGGEKIGICGRTGAGKSTIMTALYRLTELAQGRVIIDGVDISTIGLYDLRSKLAIIPQDPVLFKGTIRRNLDPFGECSDEDLWETLVQGGAFTSTQLKRIKKQKPINGDFNFLHKFHLDQIINDEGSNFSLGERQLLTLSRALVRKSKILILDEATSSVDYETDAKIQSKIAAGFADSTILCIAHRLKTIIHYDKILVLDKGEVREYDIPLNLFLQKDSIFREMCIRSGISEKDF